MRRNGAPRIKLATLSQIDVLHKMACMNTMMKSDVTATPDHSSRWHAALALRFEATQGATRITERAHSGPLRLLKPLYPEGDSNCHAVIVHPPGGIVAGDALVANVRVASAAHAVVTTPGAQKWYRSTSSGASADTRLWVESDAALEWLPQEAIVFDGAVATQNIVIDLGAKAKFFGWEMVCFGRRARDERFRQGSFAQDIRVIRDDALLWQETARWIGADPLFDSALGWGGQTVSATAWLAAGHSDAARGASDQALLSAIREALGAEIRSGASNPAPGFFVVKAIGADAESVRELLICVWSRIRLDVFGLEPQRPRIWST